MKKKREGEERDRDRGGYKDCVGERKVTKIDLKMERKKRGKTHNNNNLKKR